MYEADLAWVHAVGFGGSIEVIATGVIMEICAAGVDSGLIVDVGCGAGGMSQALSGVGYDVIGLDVSAPMVTLARIAYPNLTFEVGSIWEWTVPSCAAIVSLGEVLSYRASEDAEVDLDGLIDRMYASLEDGGVLIFDVGEVGLDRDRAPSSMEGDGWRCDVVFSYDASRDRLIRDITTHRAMGDGAARTSAERHVVQLYDPTALEARLVTAGFGVQVVRSFGGCELMPGRVGFVARKG